MSRMSAVGSAGGSQSTEQTARGAAGRRAVLCCAVLGAQCSHTGRAQGLLCHRCQLQFTFLSVNASEGKVSEGSSTQGTCGAEQCLQQLLSVVLCWLQSAGGVRCAVRSTAVLLPTRG